MENVREPFQGVWNIVRFNWHLYVLAAAVGLTLLGGALAVEGNVRMVFAFALAVGAVQMLVSLVVSHLIYDRSHLYSLGILDRAMFRDIETIVNIHAGFDETSEGLRKKFPQARLVIWDFYDPARHTEISIQRARAAYPPHPEQDVISTRQLPFESGEADLACLILSVHEIRNREEQERFFAELHRILDDRGRVFVIEHLRDCWNLLAYSMGAFHFFSRSHWLEVFRSAGFDVIEETRHTPFLSVFLLAKS